jgi:phospholipase C
MNARSCAAIALLAYTAACSNVHSAAPVLPNAGADNALLSTQLSPGKYIKHIVIIVQENRSFDNVFANFPGTDKVTGGYNSKHVFVKLQPIGFTGAKADFNHVWPIALANWDSGKMDGFDRNTYGSGTGTSGPAGNRAYSYLNHTAVAPYWAMAQQYVLADRMFPGEFGASFTGHQYLITGRSLLNPTAPLAQRQAVVDLPSTYPWGCDAPAGTTTPILSNLGAASKYAETETYKGPAPCYTYASMAQTLDAAHVSWRYYAPMVGGSDKAGSLWSAFDAIKSVRDNPAEWPANGLPAGSGQSWPQTNVLADAASGNLPAVSWVIPDSLDSDHPSFASDKGPSWVATVVNAIGKSKDWNSTAIIVVWDDWGGWYDHVPPPQLDYGGLGIRVPCLIISPYTQPHVSHTQYEFGSVLKFVEQVFNLPALGAGATDARAASLVDSFDFGIAPRAFKPIPVPVTPDYFVRRPPSLVAPDSE